MASDGTLKFDTSLDTSGLEKNTSSLGSVAKNALGVFAGNLMTKAVDAVVNLGKEALNSGMSFETSMAKVSTLFTGTDEEFGKLSDTILDLSSATGLAADGLAEAAYSALSASVPAEDLGFTLEKSAKLAAAGFTDVDTALSATAKTMNAYGMSGEESLDKVQKVLIQTQNLGITTVGELGASLAQVTPTAAAFGVSFEQVGASLATMTAQGTPTAQATTQLNSLIAELGKNGTVAAKNLEKAAEGSKYAGMSFNEMMDAGATLDEVLGMMQASADASGVSMVDMFSSIEAGKAAMSIFTQEGEVFHSNLEQMGTDADVVDDAYAKVSDTLEFKSQQIKTSLSNIATSLYSMAAGPLADAADAAAGALAEIQKGFSENGLAGVGDAILGMMESAAEKLENFDWEGAADKIVEKITNFIDGNGTGRFLETAGRIITALVQGIGKALPKLLPAIVKLVAYMVTSLIKQIPKLLQAGVDLVKGIVNGLISALPNIGQAILDIGRAILDAFKSFFGIASPSTVMQEQGNFLVEGVINALIALPGKMAEVFSDALAKLLEWGQNMLQSAGTAMTNMLSKISTIVSQLPGKVWTFLVNTVTRLVQWGQQMLSNASTAMTNMLSKINSIVQQLPGKVWTHLVNTINKLIAWGQQMLSNASTAMTNMLSKINSIVQQLPGKVWTHLVNTVNKLIQWGQQMLSNASTAMSNMLSKVNSIVSELPGKIWTHLVNAVNKVVSWGQQMVSNASTAASNMLSKVSSTLSQLPGQVWTHLSNAAAKVVSWGSELASKGAAAAKQLFDSVVNGLKDLPSRITSIGSDIVSGLWNGISSGWDWLKNKVSNLATSLLDSAKNALGIDSPSTEFRDEVGHWLPPGIAEGFEDSMPRAIKDMKAQAAKMVGQMQTAISASAGTLALNAAGPANLRAMSTVGTIVNNDNHFEQENTYNVPVATPSEVSKAQREALRNMVGGVK